MLISWSLMDSNSNESELLSFVDEGRFLFWKRASEEFSKFDSFASEKRLVNDEKGLGALDFWFSIAELPWFDVDEVSFLGLKA